MNITLQSEPILIIKNLVKVYYTSSGQTIKAVNDISFSVRKGEIFALLGPNGAGKTTTIGMITTRVKITSGDISISGLSVKNQSKEVKKKIGVVPQVMGLDRSLTAWENLIFHAKYFGVPKQIREKRAKELLELMALTKRAHDYPTTYSEGMARRLTIARALMHNPEIIFLDEATTGLDPQSRLMIWHKIRELNQAGHTIFLTTHYMEEAEELCHQVAIMDNGKILALDEPAKLKTIVPGGNVVELKTLPFSPHLATWLTQELVGLHKVEQLDASFKLYLDHPEANIMKIINIAQKHALKVESIQVHGITLEDVFIKLTGKGLRE